MTATKDMPRAEAIAPDLVFRDLPLREEIQLAIQMSGYVTPTSIQAEIVPHMLADRDILAQSQTGTGKTAAFALPILSNLDLDGGKPQVLVLAPTRELATQVAKSFETYGACIPKLRVVAIYGGADYDPQLRALKRGVHIVVGTPGRVIDHIRRGTLKLDGVKCLVLDEADEMLNMGFLEDVQFVLDGTPKEKQIALFSATLPGPIRNIADQYLREPAVVTIKHRTLTAESIEQRCVFVNEGDKLEMLARMLEYEDTDGVIVFTKTKDSTVVVAEQLVELGLKSAALNGDLPQTRRQRTVDQLKSGQLDILVATDVAARGLDVQRISHVFNYDLPHDGESYVHRIGRTGRAGRAGVAIIFLTPRQRGKLRLIEKVTSQTIQVVEPPSANDINNKRIARFKEQVAKSAAHPDLGLFKKIVTEYAEESAQSLELIAAALAHMAQGGRPLLVKDMPRRESMAYDRRDSRDSRDEERGAPRSRRPVGDPRQGMRRYRIEVGRAHGVRPNNIVGAIANEAGISGRDIGSIDIHREFSTLDLPAGLPSEVFDKLQRTWVSGKQLKIRPERGAEERPSYKPQSRERRSEQRPSEQPRSEQPRSEVRRSEERRSEERRSEENTSPPPPRAKRAKPELTASASADRPVRTKSSTSKPKWKERPASPTSKKYPSKKLVAKVGAGKAAKPAKPSKPKAKSKLSELADSIVNGSNA